MGPTSNIALVVLALGKPPELPKMRRRPKSRWSLGGRPEDLGFWKLQGRPGGSAASAQIDPVVPARREESDRPDRQAG